MSKEVDATIGNILDILKNAIDNVDEAYNRAEDASSAAEDAGHLLSKVVELIKLRREYEDNGELTTYIESMDGSIDNLCKQIAQIKKGR